jgi:hypothetical protein
MYGNKGGETTRETDEKNYGIITPNFSSENIFCVWQYNPIPYNEHGYLHAA